MVRLTIAELSTLKPPFLKLDNGHCRFVVREMVQERIRSCGLMETMVVGLQR
jgi:hypothetical protein